MGVHKIYGELADWYDLIDPVEDHKEEVDQFIADFERGIQGKAETLLELGAGAGNNAYFLKERFACTLTDISEPMLIRSRAQNPECEHIQGDMRTLRLERQFDAVLIHDAIVYMAELGDLKAALRTAWEHTRPGGATIIAPDCLKDNFREFTQTYEGEKGDRAFRMVEWNWTDDPAVDRCFCDYGFLLRTGTDIQMVHDRHIEGLFSKATWVEVLTELGFEVEVVKRPVFYLETDEIFLCRRPLD
jgi:SAM-dependent methyltransferase